MIQSTFQQKLDASGNIPGIYNYCNRYCEDCPFTDVCASYKMLSARFLQTENPDDLARVLEESLAASRNILEQLMKFSKIEIDDCIEDPVETMWQEKIEDAVNNHRLALKAEEYFKVVPTAFKELEDSSVLNETMTSSLQKIVSFSFHIATKMKRALNGFYEMDLLKEDDFEKEDMNGSAKCLLVMVDDSILLWEKIAGTNSSASQPISEIISLLESLRRETQIQFPEARAFIRGGFDEM